MYENPEIMRQLVNERIADGRCAAADRRRAGAVRRRNRRPVRSRLTHWFGTGRRTATVRKPATI